MFLKNYLSITIRNIQTYFNNKKTSIYFLKHNSRIIKPKSTLNVKKEYFNLGNDVVIGHNANINIYIYSEKTLKPQLTIQDHVRISDNVTILCANNIHIGKNTLIGPNVFLIDENHGKSRDYLYSAQNLDTMPIFIGENVWIGANAIILPGVTIGDNAIIGAGSVVTRNIDKDSIAAGNPARIIKQYDYSTSSWIRTKNTINK